MKKLLFILVSFTVFPVSLSADETQTEAYVAILVEIKSPEKFEHFLTQAAPIVKAYQGEIVAKGDSRLLVEGQLNLDLLVVARFPSEAAVDKFYGSEEYLRLLPVRNEAANVSILKLR